MPSRFRPCAITIAVLLATCAAHSKVPRPVFYAYDLGLDYASVAGINESGQVVGTKSDIGGSSSGFITGPNGVGISYIAPLNGATSTPAAVNAFGQVVGTAGGKPFITGLNGSAVRPLPMPVAEYRYAAATSINDQGRVVGRYEAVGADGSFETHSFITGPDGMDAQQLDGPNPNDNWANEINNLGQVVGMYRQEGSSQLRSFVTGRNGVGAVDIGTGGGESAWVTSINDSGRIGGLVSYPSGKYEGDESHPFIADPGEPMKLKKNFGGSCGSVSAINSRGDYTGFACTEYDIGRAYVAANGGKPTDLNALVVNLPQDVILRYPAGINRSGQLAVSARVLPNSKVRVFIVCPTMNCQ